MKTLMDIIKKRGESEKLQNETRCKALYDKAVAAHNGALVGIMPWWCKIPDREDFIEQE